MCAFARRAVVLLAIPVAFLISSCSNKGGVSNDGGGDDTQLLLQSVIVTPDTVYTGTSGTVRARVVYDNVNQTPAAGSVVSFSLSGVSGTITPSSDSTDADGYAVATVAPTTAGAGTVTATISGTTTTLSDAFVAAVQTASQYPGSVALNATPATLIAGSGSTSAVVATVLSVSGGDVPNGTPVVFVAGDGFVDNNNNGSYDAGDSLTYDLDGDGQWDPNGTIPASGTTNNNVASVTYTADATSVAGTVYVRATAGTASTNIASNTTTIVLTDSTGGGAGTITISIVDPILTANGVDSTALTISATDGNGDPVPNGTVVTLVAGERFIDRDSNGVYNAGTDSLYDSNGDGAWTPAGSIPQTRQMANGSVTTTFVAGTEAGIYYITATINTGALFLQTSGQITLESSTVIASIEMFPASDHIQVQGTGGLETTLLIATCYDVYGNLAPSGLDITFAILNGPNGGENLNGQGYGPVVDQTSSGGQAIVALSSGTVSGTVQCWAYWINSQTGDTTFSVVQQIEISSGPPEVLTVGIDIEDINQFALGIGNVPYDVIALCSDVYGNPVPDGTIIYFGMVGQDYNEAFVTSPDETEAGHAGAIMYTTGNIGPWTPGQLWVYCETAGGTLADTTYAIASGGAVNILPTDVPTSMNADGESSYEFVFSVTDDFGNPATSGLDINLQALYGTISNTQTNLVFPYGPCLAASVYSSPSGFERDWSFIVPDDGTIANEVITYSSPWSAPSTYSFPLLSTVADQGLSSATIPSTIYRGFTYPVTVAIEDAWDNVLGGHRIDFTVSAGTVTPADTTGDTGIAVGYYTPPADTTITTDLLFVNDVDQWYGNGVYFILPITITDP